MTLEEINAINRKLAEWAGICPHEDFNHLTESDFFEGMPVCSACGVRFDEKDAPPDYFRSNASQDLLGVLVEKGYSIILDLNRNGVLTYVWHGKTRVFEGHYNTIPAAICRACLGVAEREGKE